MDIIAALIFCVVDNDDEVQNSIRSISIEADHVEIEKWQMLVTNDIVVKNK